VKELLKSREDKKDTTTEKDLMARGIVSSFDPNPEGEEKELPDPIALSGIDLNDVRSFLMQYSSIFSSYFHFSK
jgi:hypothetical protein